MVYNHYDIKTMQDVLEIYPIINFDDFKRLYEILFKYRAIISTPIELTQIGFKSSTTKEWLVKIRIYYPSLRTLDFKSFKKSIQNLKNELVIFC